MGELIAIVCFVLSAGLLFPAVRANPLALTLAVFFTIGSTISVVWEGMAYVKALWPSHSQTAAIAPQTQPAIQPTTAPSTDATQQPAQEATAPATDNTQTPVTSPSTNPAAPDDRSVELKFWDSVDKSDPTQLQAYLDQYPSGEFSRLARRRIALLTAPKIAPTTQDQTANQTQPAHAPVCVEFNGKTICDSQNQAAPQQ